MSETYGGRTFDRKVGFDRRSFDYLVTELAVAPRPSAYDKLLEARLAKVEAVVFPPTPPGPTPPPAPGVQPIIWACSILLDQGPEGECVGHGFAHWLAATPMAQSVLGSSLQNPIAEHLYERAQQIDGSPPDEQSGATVTAGVKATQEGGHVASYSWALTVAQISVGLKSRPGVLGIPWRRQMMNPDSHGVLNVGTAADDVGGHCILLNEEWPKGSFSNVEDFYAVHQSWGNWGQNGKALISAAGLADLLADQGECVFPVKK